MNDSWSGFSTEPIGLGPETIDQIYGRGDRLQCDSSAVYPVTDFTPNEMSDFSATQLQGLDFGNLPPFQHTQLPSFHLTELQDFALADTLGYPSLELPSFQAIEAATSAPTEMPALLSAVTEPPTWTSTKIHTSPLKETTFPASIHPPSPPTSVEPAVKLERRMTYADAYSHGNVLLCVPRRVRKRIYSDLLADYPELRNIEIPEIGDFSKPFPEFCHSCNLIYFEACLLMIESATFTLSSDGAIFNLMVFLNEFLDKKGYNAVQSLEFAGRTAFETQEMALGLFKKGDFTSNATELLRRCPNVKEISLILSLKDLPWTFGDGGQALNVTELTKKYDLASIIELCQLEVIKLSLQPFMALKKTVKAMEKTTKLAQLRGFKGSGLEGFWGLKEWFEMQALNRTRLVEVRCPILQQLG